ncbi:MAG: recombination protein RecR [Candidatus Azotimanducaceae bacterium]|jgi:recombination protein RecR|tara:strand:- start:2440 stop:3039 length:600 start_codon:yes stop_codon:yes gene_type:complete
MSLIDDLVAAFQVLPGVGPKSAQRMALHLLQRNRRGGTHLGQILETAMDEVRQCTLCRNLTEGEICRLCSDERRDNGLLCVVESPADVLAIEQAGGFRGYYFVLHGRLSPIDGLGPEQLGLQALQSRIAAIQPSEMILATNPTVEGEATAHYISRLVADQVPNISRIAHGVPLGGEIEYTDGGTLTHALQGRRNISLLD